MINRLEVEGLNNRVDANWKFNEDLNIITGANGSGKTTLLKLIWYLISGNLERIILEIELRSVLIQTDKFSFFLRSKPDEVKVEYDFFEAEKGSRTIPIDRVERAFHADNIRLTEIMKSSLFFPTFRRIEGAFSRPTGYFSEDRAQYRSDRFRRLNPARATDMLEHTVTQFSNELSNFGHEFISSISTDDIVRLITRKYADVSEQTNALHSELSKEIIEKIEQYSIGEEKSSKENIQKIGDYLSSGKELQKELLETSVESSNIRNALSGENILDAFSIVGRIFEAASILEDIGERVKQVTDERDRLLRPFSALSDLIGTIFRYQGIRLTEGITFGEASEAIASDKLSAGEQQMLSFLCYNAFSENSAIFIDEPELSLHVDWQRLLMPTLLNQRTGNQFFIATHSPFIYARYPDKEILLGSDRGGEI